MDLSAPIETIKGIGPKTAAVLNKSGIKTVRDFFYNLPREYDNFTAPTNISEIKPGKVVIKGKIDSISTHRARTRRLNITEGIIRDKTDTIRVVWFNQAYRAKQFEPNREYYFTGSYELKYGRYQLISPSAALAADVEVNNSLMPIYVAHGAVKSHNFQRLIAGSRDKFALIPDLLPTVKPGTRQNALFNIHFPTNSNEIKEARDYLAYEELFALILAAKLNKKENQKLKSIQIPFNASIIKEFVSKLPFQLTNAQRLASWEIFQDMGKKTPMNRLLQGDVGSGKTMVAALAAYAAAMQHTQVALLAPTAILATQHYQNLQQTLAPFGIKTTLLTGATKKKNELKKSIKAGEIDFVIGTHALLTDDTEFNNLALVIIDEQHRFGVEQRQKLMLKSPHDTAPHLLSMTATPIPRSLQLTIFGDLDVSILNELPKGRQPITTKIITEVNQKTDLYPKITAEIAAGHQAYWICKAIDDTTKSEATSVKARTEKLKKVFPKLRIEFLHGRMKPVEKDEIMERFAEGKIDILVSTTVVEVGVDVPNSTLMVIEDAENYGLAQLHQLRGRVGRGQAASYCYLLTSGDNPPSRRLKELEHSSDGFHLAEVDLNLRGPGEIYGALQHGALDLRIATLSDTKLIKRAQDDTTEFLNHPEYLKCCTELMDSIKKYQQLTTLN